MREETTLLFQGTETETGRNTTITLNDDIDNYDILRVYLGFKADNCQVRELPVSLFNISNTRFLWTHYAAGGTPTNMASIRQALFKMDANNKRTLSLYACVKITYLNNGTSNLNCTTGNTWQQRPIYKIVGVKFVR